MSNVKFQMSNVKQISNVECQMMNDICQKSNVKCQHVFCHYLGTFSSTQFGSENDDQQSFCHFESRKSKTCVPGGMGLIDRLDLNFIYSRHGKTLLLQVASEQIITNMVALMFLTKFPVDYSQGKGKGLPHTCVIFHA